MDNELLEEIGLTKGEIKVYLALLRLGETTTGDIIKSAKISGGKIYVILDKLIEKGLASFIIKDKTKNFSAANPKMILNYIEEKESVLESKKKKIEAQLPSLLKISKSLKKNYNSKIYLGYKGIKTAISELLDDLNSKDEVLIMGVNLSRDERYNLLWKKWHSERIKKGINAKIIFSEKDEVYFKTFSKMKKTEARILRGLTPSSVGILGNKILLTTYGEEPSGILIEHPDTSKSFVTFFNQLWKLSKKI